MTEAATHDRDDRLIRAHIIAALTTLFISVMFGINVALKMHMPELMGNSAALTWGRMRYNHTQGVFFGWLTNAFLAFMYYATPVLARRPVLSRRLGWILFAILNFAVVLPGWALVMAGQSQPMEWAEFPLVIDAFVVLAFLLMVAQFAVPLLRTPPAKLYVTGWYILGAVVFTLLAYPMGNVVPQLLPGAQGAAFSGLWIHDAIGLWITPIALAIAYYMIPVLTNKRIYSHFLSMIGFWLLFFVYPLNGTHHYVFSAIPMEAQIGAIVASVILGVDVLIVVANLKLSLKGAGTILASNYMLRYVRMGIIIYLLVAIQGSLQALMPVNKLVHFSDWVIGHSHMAMLGFASFITMGGIAYVWKQLPGSRFSDRWLAWSYWLLLFGLFMMFFDLTTAGLLEAHLWSSMTPWLESLRAAKTYWIVRSFSAIPITLALAFFAQAFMSGPKSETQKDDSFVNVALPEPVKGVDKEGASPQPKRFASILNMAYLSAFVAGVGFFIFSFVLLGVAPALKLEAEIKRTKPATMPVLTASQEAGRQIFAKEGCAYCHTQQVRTIQADVDRFGAPTRAWETKYDYPQLWGTRRIGPDLARESGTRSIDWQMAHLFNPRLVVPESNMPSYKWLFDGSPDMPKQEARDLVAYLQSLGSARQLAGLDPVTIALSPDCDCPEDVKKLESQFGIINGNPSAPRQGSAGLIAISTDPSQLASDRRRGADLFNQNCATCHGAEGRGNGAAAPSLLPPPANLRDRRLSPVRISRALINGVYGTAMPAWRDLPQRDLQALAAYVSNLAHIGPYPSKTKSPPEAKTLFDQNCASCHGVNGDGAGNASASINPPPSNFHEVVPAYHHAYNVITDGVPGTSMPPWKQQLTDQQRLQLAAYVRSFGQ